MKKKLLTTLLAACLSAATITTSFAGTWMRDANGWWYQNDDGSYTVNDWQWIDGDNDGIAEAYYFNADGYCLMNTYTPDGYYVNASGACVMDEVLTRVVATSPVPTESQATDVTVETAAVESTVATHTGISAEAYEGYTIIVNVNTGKYHVPSCNSVTDMKTENTGYCSDAAYLNANGYQPCKRCH